MAKINVLSKNISELIAAGEVIERPSSVIKELVENSIDAGAHHITVEIKNGGTTYMRIADDGCGMTSEDTATSFLRHATSKITSKDDLEKILTLGFRGEALASVSAVSRVEVLTKRADDNLGTHYAIDGSVEQYSESIGCPDGTTIIVRDLFYNVPARKKFLKKDASESGAVNTIIQKIALSHPEVSFRFIRDNKQEFVSPGNGDLYADIYAVYGKALANDMIEVDTTEDGIRVHGYVIKPLYAKNNRAFQNFFVNGRYIKSMTCSVSIEEAYRSLIMVGKFPACVLMLEIPPQIVDVNVHPAKVEVKFSDEKLIFNCIYFAVKNALMKSGLIYEFQVKKPSDWFAAEEKEEKESFNQPELVPVNYEITMTDKEKQSLAINISISENNAPKTQKTDEPIVKPHGIDITENVIDEEPNIYVPDMPAEFKYINTAAFVRKEEVHTVTQTQATKEEPQEKIRIIGEAFFSYIISECGDNVIFIDKHAAHERIIYERLKDENKVIESQMLINPCEVLLPAEQYEAVSESLDLLRRMGFKIEMCENSCIKILSAPMLFDGLDLDDLLPEIAENIYDNKVNPQAGILDDMFHTFACKAAIKAHDKNSNEELQSLAEQVYYNERIRHCPHGRPILFTLSKYDFEKQFKRR